MCPYKLPLSSFLKDALASPSSQIYSTCIQCRSKKNASNGKKRVALQSLDPNIQPTKRVCRSNSLQPTVTSPRPLSNPPPEPPRAPVTVLPLTEPAGFLPTDEWCYIQGFNKAMAAVQLEMCERCQEHGFSMDLTDSVCHCCFLRDTDNRKRPITPFLMSTENHMDPGTVPGHLPELTQVEEMVIAQAHVQMLVKRVRGHQYQYTGHCVTFLQNIVRTVDILPNLPAELDIVLLRPPESLTDDTRYQ
jgi:hypothetical protein